MPNVFLAPRSNETSYKNFESTILGGRDYQFFEPYLTAQEKEILSRHKKVSIWGNQESLKNRWVKMVPGDFVLFYAHGAFYYSARVLLTKFDRELASKLWPLGKSGKPWSCLFFVENLRQIHIPIEVVQQLADYEPTWDRVQGFMMLRESGIRAIESQFASIASFLDQPAIFHEAIDRVLEHKNDETVIGEVKEGQVDIDAILAKAKAYQHEGPNHVVHELSKKFRVDNRAQKQRVAILENYLCQLCGWSLIWKDKQGKKRYRIDVDHIVDKSLGGTEELHNLWTLCPNCHIKKTMGVIKLDPNDKKIYENGTEIRLKTDKHLGW